MENIVHCLALIKPFTQLMLCSRSVVEKQYNIYISFSFLYFFDIFFRLFTNYIFTDYAAVLTGHGIQGSATARFYFRKKTLQYSFLMGEQLGWPDELTFLDKDDNILEDFTLSKTSLQNQTDKLCGAWERLPRKYRRLLRSDGLDVSLSTNNGIIRGNIKKYYGLNSELFSGLFDDAVGAGTAIVSVSPGTGSIHTNILFKGISKEGLEKVKFIVKFHTTGDVHLENEESVVLDMVGPSTVRFENIKLLSAEIMSINAHQTCFYCVWSSAAINPGYLIISDNPSVYDKSTLMLKLE